MVFICYRQAKDGQQGLVHNRQEGPAVLRYDWLSYRRQSLRAGHKRLAS